RAQRGQQDSFELLRRSLVVGPPEREETERSIPRKARPRKIQRNGCIVVGAAIPLDAAPSGDQREVRLGEPERNGVATLPGAQALQLAQVDSRIVPAAGVVVAAPEEDRTRREH